MLQFMEGVRIINKCKYLKYPENDANMSDWIAPVYVPEFQQRA